MLTFRVSRLRYALYLVVVLIAVAVGTLMVLGGERLLGGLSVAFFGLCAAVFIRELTRTEPRLTIDDAGILDRSLGLGLIRWEDVDDAWAARVSGQPFLCLVLRDPERYLARLGPIKRRLAKMNGALGFTELSLNLSGLAGASPERLESLVRSQVAARRASPLDVEGAGLDLTAAEIVAAVREARARGAGPAGA